MLIELESRIAFDAAAGQTVDKAAEDSEPAQHDAASGADPAVADTHAAFVEALARTTETAAEPPPIEIVFVDASVENAAELLKTIDPRAEIVMIEPGTNGVERIAEVLRGRHGVDAVHIVSHGGPGELRLGTEVLDADSMAGRHAEDLAVIRSSLAPGADILIYGCDFAATDKGLRAVERLGSLTGADLAASTDATGSDLRGGNWTLEYRLGRVETDIALSRAGSEAYAGLLAVNERPVNTLPASGYVTDEDVAVRLSGLSVADADAGGDVYTVVLEVSSGKLAATSGSGVTVAGSATATLTLSGSLTAVNAYLASASAPVYTPARDVNGSATLTMTTTDAGHGGAGAAQTDTDTQAITIFSVDELQANGLPVNSAPVNGAPVNDVPGTQSVNEDGVLVFSAANGNAITVSDADGGTQSVTLNVTNGTLTLSGLAGLTFTRGDGDGDQFMVFSGTVAAINAALDGLQFIPLADYNGGAEISLTAGGALSTAGGWVNGGFEIPNYADINNYRLVNESAVTGWDTDAPNGLIEIWDSGYQGIASFDGDQFVEINATQVAALSQTFTPAAGSALSIQFSHRGRQGIDTMRVRAVDLGADGLVNTGDDTVLLNETFADNNIVWSSYSRNLTALASGNRLRLEFSSVSSAGGGGSGNFIDGVNVQQGVVDVDKINVNIVAVADAVPDAIVTNEDTQIVFNALTGSGGGSADNFENSGRSVLSITQPPSAHGTVTYNANGTLTFRPTANFNGATSFTYTVASNGTTETVTVSVGVVAVDDAPVNTVPAAQTTAEDTARIFSAANGNALAVTDIEGGLLTVSLSVTNGAFSLSGLAGLVFTTGDGTGDAAMTFRGTAASINAALAGARFEPGADYNGSALLTFQTSDGTTTDTDTVAFTVAAVADIANDTATIRADAAATIDIFANDGFSDPGRIVTAINGQAITAGGAGVAVTNGSVSLTLGGQLVFTPTANTDGSASFTYTARAGGISETATVGVTLTAVNTAPVNTLPAGFTTVEDGALALAGLQIADADAGSGTLTVRLTVDTGRLTLAGATGIVSSGSGTSSLTLSGTLADIRALLATTAALVYTPAADVFGTAILTMVTDDGGNSGLGGVLVDTDTATITVTSVNDAPTAANGTIVATEDTTYSGTLPHAVDVDGDSLTYALGALAPSYGTVTIAANGTYTYVPQTHFNGTDSFSYSVSDGRGGLVVHTVAITVAAQNDAPVGTSLPDTTRVDGGTVLFDAAAAFGDVDGDTLSFTQTGLPPGLSISSSGMVSGVLSTSASIGGPNGDGVYTATITASDGQGGSTSLAYVLRATNIAPVAVNDTVTTAEDTPLTFNVLDGTAGGSAADSDADGDALSVVSATASHGTVVIGSGGLLTYTANADFIGTDTIAYWISDGDGGWATATVTVTVSPVNDPPAGSPIPDRVRNDGDSDRIEIASFFTDAENDVLTFGATGLPAGLTIDAVTGTISGTLAPDASGPSGTQDYTVTVTADDGTDTTSVSFLYTVSNLPPVALNDTIVTAEDTPVDIDVLANDSDIDGDAIHVTAVDGRSIVLGGPALAIGGGQVELLLVGGREVLRFTPDADDAGPVAFTYTTSDDSGGTDGASVSIQVTPVNDAPRPAPVADRVRAEGEAFTYDLGDFFADPEKTTPNYTISGLPAGLIFNQATGVVSGTIAAGAATAVLNGVYTVVVTAYDGPGATGLSAQASFTLTVDNAAPITVDDVASVLEDATVSFNVLNGTASSGAADPAGLQVTGAVAAHGSVVFAANGTMTYTPATDYTGVDTLVYRVVDGFGAVSTGIVNISVGPVNDSPIALPIAAMLRNDGAAISFAGHFVDAEGDPLTYTISNLPPGLAYDPATGLITGTLAADASGPTGTRDYTVTIEANDGQGGIGTTTFVYTIKNLAPDAANDTASTNEDTAVSIDILANDTDPDGDATRTVSVGGVTLTVGGPAADTGKGSVALVSEGGRTVLRFTPTADYHGFESFTYTVGDGNGGFDTASVTVTVAPVNDAPVAVAFAARTGSDGAAVAVNVSTLFRDVDGDDLDYVIAGLPPGLVYDAETGLVSGTLAAGASQGSPYTVTVTANDRAGGLGLGASASFQFTVTNPSPSAADDAVSTNEDQAVTFHPVTGAGTASGAAGQDADPDGDAVSVSAVGGQAIAPGGTVTLAEGMVRLNANGTLTFTPAADFSGTAVIPYLVRDADGATAGATITVTVAPVADAPVLDLDSAAAGTGHVASFVENGTPVGLAGSGPTIFDAESDIVELAIDLVGPFPDGGAETLRLAGTAIQVGTAASGTAIVGATSIAFAYDGAGSIVVRHAGGAGTPIPSGDLASLVASIDYENIGDDPTAGARGFSFAATDSSGAVSAASVSTITVVPVDDAPVGAADAGGTGEHAPLTVAAAGGVLANDVDPEGGATTVTAVAGTVAGVGTATAGTNGGLFTIGADGGYRFDPNGDFEVLRLGETATTTIVYTVADGAGNIGTATLTITVTGGNEAPASADSAVSTSEDQTLSGTLPAAVDVDGDTLVYAASAQPQHGTVSIGASGTYTYVPNADYNGPDSFTYTVSDGIATRSFTVAVTVLAVDDTPVATGSLTAQSFSDAQSVSIATAGAFAERDGEVLGFSATGLPAGLSIDAATGVISGTIASDASQTAAGAYDVNVTARDPGGASVSTRFALHVANIGPHAANDDVATLQGTPSTGSVFADNGNGADLDADGDTLVVSAVGGTSSHIGAALPGSQGGHFTIDADGFYRFDPGSDFDDLPAGASRTTSIDYTVSDGEGGTSSATLSVEVAGRDDAPAGSDTVVAAEEDTPFFGRLPIASDAEGDAIVYSADTAPAHGALAINADGTFLYTPDSGFNGADSFTYRVTAGGLSSVYTATVDVAVQNDAPVAGADGFVFTEDRSLILRPLANDADPESDGLTITEIDGTAIYTGREVAVAHGSVTLNGDGTLIFRPEADYTGPISFTYTISDGGGGTAAATVTGAGIPVNDAPAARDDAGRTGENAVAAGNVITGPSGADTDIDGDTLVVVGVDGAGAPGQAFEGSGGGRFTIQADGTFRFDPGTAFDDLQAGESRTTAVAYTVSDGRGGLAGAVLTITVDGANDAPAAAVLPAREGEDGNTVSFDAGAVFADADDAALVFRVTGLPAGLVFDPATGRIGGTLAADASGASGSRIYTVVVTAEDGAGGAVSRRFDWTIVNPAPVAEDDTAAGPQGVALSGSVFGDNGNGPDTDRDGDTLVVGLVATVSHGTLTLRPDGSYTYVPRQSFYGTDRFTYSLDDGNGGRDIATVTITIAPPPDVDLASPFPTGETGRLPVAPSRETPARVLADTVVIDSLDLVEGLGSITAGIDADEAIVGASVKALGGVHGMATLAADGPIGDVVRHIDDFDRRAGWGTGGPIASVLSRWEADPSLGAFSTPTSFDLAVTVVDGRLAIDISFDEDSADVAGYQITMADGRALPGWIRIGADGGIVAIPPNGTGSFSFRIQGTTADGDIVEDIVTVDAQTGATTRHVGRPGASPTAQFFSRQLAPF